MFTRVTVAATVLALVAGTAAVAGPAGAASSTTSPSANPGITTNSVTVGQVDTLSGPVPGLFQGAKDGTQAYFNYVNSHGGINGRKLHLVADDDQFSSATYASDTASLVKTTFALVGGFSLFDAAGVPAINQAKIPDITPSLSTARETDQYNYAPVPIVNGGSRLGPLEYYKKTFGDAYLHVGTIDSAVATAESQTQGVLNSMRSIGYKVVYEHTDSPVQTDFTPDIIRMRAAGVQMVYIQGLAVNQSADLAKQMQLQNFHPKVFANGGGNYDTSYIPTAGSAANGTLVDQQTAMYIGQDAKVVPEVALFDKWVKKENPGGPIDTYALFGWESGMIFAKALKAAGKNPTRSSLFAQLDKVTSFNGNGLQATTNPAQKKPGTCWLLIKVVNGQWKRVSPSPKSSFICKPGGYYYPPGYHFTRQPPPSS